MPLHKQLDSDLNTAMLKCRPVSDRLTLRRTSGANMGLAADKHHDSGNWFGTERAVISISSVRRLVLLELHACQTVRPGGKLGGGLFQPAGPGLLLLSEVACLAPINMN